MYATSILKAKAITTQLTTRGPEASRKSSQCRDLESDNQPTAKYGMQNMEKTRTTQPKGNATKVMQIIEQRQITE
jgi:hypothetical protein